MIIGKKYKFDSAHYIPNHPKCGKIHGHTFHVTVELEGLVQDDGMVLDFHKLDILMSNELNFLDHMLLNDRFPLPTIEYLARDIFISVSLGLKFEDVRVNSITVQEGDGGYAKVNSAGEKEEG